MTIPAEELEFLNRKQGRTAASLSLSLLSVRFRLSRERRAGRRRIPTLRFPCFFRDRVPRIGRFRRSADIRGCAFVPRSSRVISTLELVMLGGDWNVEFRQRDVFKRNENRKLYLLRYEESFESLFYMCKISNRKLHWCRHRNYQNGQNDQFVIFVIYFKNLELFESIKIHCFTSVKYPTENYTGVDTGTTKMVKIINL